MRAERFQFIPADIKTALEDKLPKDFFTNNYQQASRAVLSGELENSQTIDDSVALRAALNGYTRVFERSLKDKDKAGNSRDPFKATTVFAKPPNGKKITIKEILPYIKGSTEMLQALKTKGAKFSLESRQAAAQIGDLEAYKFLVKETTLWNTTRDVQESNSADDFIIAARAGQNNILEHILSSGRTELLIMKLLGSHAGSWSKKLQEFNRVPFPAKTRDFLHNAFLTFTGRTLIPSEIKLKPATLTNKIFLSKRLEDFLEKADNPSLAGSILVNSFLPEEVGAKLKGAYFVTNEDGTIPRSLDSMPVSLGTSYPADPEELGMKLIKPSELAWDQFGNLEYCLEGLIHSLCIGSTTSELLVSNRSSVNRSLYQSIINNAKFDNNFDFYKVNFMNNSPLLIKENDEKPALFKSKTLAGKFRDCRLDNLDFTGTDFTNALVDKKCTFTKANIEGTKAVPARMLVGTIGNPASIQNMSLELSNELLRLKAAEPGGLIKSEGQLQELMTRANQTLRR